MLSVQTLVIRIVGWNSPRWTHCCTALAEKVDVARRHECNIVQHVAATYHVNVGGYTPNNAFQLLFFLQLFCAASCKKMLSILLRTIFYFSLFRNETLDLGLFILGFSSSFYHLFHNSLIEVEGEAGAGECSSRLKNVLIITSHFV